jgi:hypothetical protein
MSRPVALRRRADSPATAGYFSHQMQALHPIDQGDRANTRAGD